MLNFNQKNKGAIHLTRYNFFSFSLFLLRVNLGPLVLVIHLYNKHRPICRSTDSSVKRPQAEIRTRDGRTSDYARPPIFLFCAARTVGDGAGGPAVPGRRGAERHLPVPPPAQPADPAPPLDPPAGRPARLPGGQRRGRSGRH